MAVIKFEGNRGYGLNDSGGIIITNSTTESTLFSAVIPAGKMGTSKILKFEAVFHITTPAISLPSLTLKLKFGSAILTLITSSALNIGVTDKPIIIRGKIMNMTNASQFVVAEILNNSGGVNILSSLSSSSLVTDNTFAVDTTIDQTIAITAQFSLLSSTTSITTKIVEVNLT